MNALMPRLCLSPVSGQSWAALITYATPMEEIRRESSKPPPSLEPGGNGTGQSGKWRGSRMASGDSEDCLDILKRVDSLARTLSVPDKPSVLWVY